MFCNVDPPIAPTLCENDFEGKEVTGREERKEMPSTSSENRTSLLHLIGRSVLSKASGMEEVK